MSFNISSIIQLVSPQFLMTVTVLLLIKPVWYVYFSRMLAGRNIMTTYFLTRFLLNLISNCWLWPRNGNRPRQRTTQTAVKNQPAPWMLKMIETRIFFFEKIKLGPNFSQCDNTSYLIGVCCHRDQGSHVYSCQNCIFTCCTKSFK